MLLAVARDDTKKIKIACPISAALMRIAHVSVIWHAPLPDGPDQDMQTAMPRRSAGVDEGLLVNLTSTDLLIGMRDVGNDRIWSTFSARYRPMLVSFGIHLGLCGNDAEDAAQETLVTFAQAYGEGKYNPEKGSLRNWLFGIAKHKIRDINRRKPPETELPQGSNPTGWLEAHPDDHSLSEIWEAQWRRAVLQECLNRVRQEVQPSTLRIFEMCVLEGWAVENVATELNMTKDTVYKARSRVLTRLRNLRDQLNVDW